MHDSGNLYEIEKGYPQDIIDAPSELIALLGRPTFYRVSNNGLDLDIDGQHIVTLLGYVNPDCDYNQWVSVGMAIHHCLNGGVLDTGTHGQQRAQILRLWQNTKTLAFIR